MKIDCETLFITNFMVQLRQLLLWITCSTLYIGLLYHVVYDYYNWEAVHINVFNFQKDWR